MKLGDDANKALNEMLRNAKHVSELAADDPLQHKCQVLGNLFTEHVRFLKEQVPNCAINQLGRMIWDLVGHRVTLIAVGADVDVVSFLAYKRAGVLQGQIMIPTEWEALCAANPLLQMGAVICNGSMAVDVYNERVENEPQTVILRAQMYEAEFLRTFVNDFPDIASMFSDYHKEVLKDFPEGIESEKAKSLIYESKPFIAPFS